MLLRAVDAVIESDYADFELIIVDQSGDDRTRAALAPMLNDARVRYVHSSMRGKGLALNRGLAEAKAEIVACTDDDCIVASDWIGTIVAAFARSPAVAVIFGTVDAGPHDGSTGYIPTYRPAKEHLATSILDDVWVRGLGASMGLRRSAIERIGGFDPALGPGSRFGAGEDWDIAARALLGGFAVLELPGARVIHEGFRSFQDGRDHARRDWYGIGMMCAKPLRRGYWRALVVAARLVAGRALFPPLRDIAHLRRPSGLMRIAAFTQGFARGLRAPLQRDALAFDLEP